MVKEWPRRQAQTKAAVKKERPLREKVISEVRKRVSQIRETLKPALENSTVSGNATKELNQMADNVAKVCVCVCVCVRSQFDFCEVLAEQMMRTLGQSEFVAQIGEY